MVWVVITTTNAAATIAIVDRWPGVRSAQRRKLWKIRAGRFEGAERRHAAAIASTADRPGDAAECPCGSGKVCVGPRGGQLSSMLARISHQGRCIGPGNLRKSFCEKGLSDSECGVRCRHSVSLSSSIRRVRWPSRGGSVRRRGGDVGCRGVAAAGDGSGDRADRSGGGMLPRRARSGPAGPLAPHPDRPADLRHRARLRGRQSTTTTCASIRFWRCSSDRLEPSRATVRRWAARAR